MNRTRQSTGILGNTCGAVMVEGVIVLPVFIIVLAAVLHFHSAFSAKLDASTQARSCAWAYSLAGCGDADIPEGCNVSDLGDDKNDIDSEGLRAGLEVVNKVGVTLLGLEAGITSRPGREVDVSSVLGGGTRKISGDYSVMCNETKMGPKDLAKKAYCALDANYSVSLPGC